MSSVREASENPILNALGDAKATPATDVRPGMGDYDDAGFSAEKAADCISRKVTPFRYLPDGVPGFVRFVIFHDRSLNEKPCREWRFCRKCRSNYSS